MIFIFFFIWLRGTLPRLRYDQFMSFGWKLLIPVSLVWIVLVAAIRLISLDGGLGRELPAGRLRGARGAVRACCFFVGEKDRAGRRDGDRRGRGGVRRLRRAATPSRR